MTFDPKQFLNIATRLFVDRNYDDHVKEAKYRTCTSRAYYAVHLFAKEKLERLGFTFPEEKDKGKGIIHYRVIDTLKGLKEKDKIVWGRKRGKREKKLWERLNDLREIRGEADYDMNKDFLNMEGNVRYSITDADDIIDKVDKLASSDFWLSTSLKSGQNMMIEEDIRIIRGIRPFEI